MLTRAYQDTDAKVASKIKELLLQWEKDVSSGTELDALKATVRSMRDEGVRFDGTASPAPRPVQKAASTDEDELNRAIAESLKLAAQTAQRQQPAPAPQPVQEKVFDLNFLPCQLLTAL